MSRVPAEGVLTAPVNPFWTSVTFRLCVLPRIRSTTLMLDMFLDVDNFVTFRFSRFPHGIPEQHSNLNVRLDPNRVQGSWQYRFACKLANRRLHCHGVNFTISPIFFGTDALISGSTNHMPLLIHSIVYSVQQSAFVVQLNLYYDSSVLPLRIL